MEKWLRDFLESEKVLHALKRHRKEQRLSLVNRNLGDAYERIRKGGSESLGTEQVAAALTIWKYHLSPDKRFSPNALFWVHKAQLREGTLHAPDFVGMEAAHKIFMESSGARKILGAAMGSGAFGSAHAPMLGRFLQSLKQGVLLREISDPFLKAGIRRVPVPKASHSKFAEAFLDAHGHFNFSGGKGWHDFEDALLRVTANFSSLQNRRALTADPKGFIELVKAAHDHPGRFTYAMGVLKGLTPRKKPRWKVAQEEEAERRRVREEQAKMERAPLPEKWEPPLPKPIKEYGRRAGTYTNAIHSLLRAKPGELAALIRKLHPVISNVEGAASYRKFLRQRALEAGKNNLRKGQSEVRKMIRNEPLKLADEFLGYHRLRKGERGEQQQFEF